MENKPVEKTVEYYLGLPYPFEVYPDVEGGWFVKFPDFPGCMTDADEWETLPARMKEVLHMFIEGRLENGDPISEPTAPYTIKKAPAPIGGSD